MFSGCTEYRYTCSPRYRDAGENLPRSEVEGGQPQLPYQTLIFTYRGQTARSGLSTKNTTEPSNQRTSVLRVKHSLNIGIKLRMF